MFATALAEFLAFLIFLGFVMGGVAFVVNFIMKDVYLAQDLDDAEPECKCCAEDCSPACDVPPESCTLRHPE